MGTILLSFLFTIQQDEYTRLRKQIINEGPDMKAARQILSAIFGKPNALKVLELPPDLKQAMFEGPCFCT